MTRTDDFSTDQKREYVVAVVVVGLVLSTLSTLLRVWARIVVIRKLRNEDWCMIAGLVFSYGPIAALLYGLSEGLVEGFEDLPFRRRSAILLSVWILQKVQPVALLLIKTSMILFNAHIFHTRRFIQLSWAVWVFTFCWTCVAVFGTTFNCSPPSAFWTLRGRCSVRVLEIVSLSSSVASSVGDIVVLAMPIPLLLKLKVSRRQRVGLVAVFTLGLFAVAASFIRWIILLVAVKQSPMFNAAHIDVIIWTYLEMSVGITCGNLPFLATLFGRGRKMSGSKYPDQTLESVPVRRRLPRSPTPKPTTAQPKALGGMAWVIGDNEGSEIVELQAVKPSLDGSLQGDNF